MEKFSTDFHDFSEDSKIASVPKYFENHLQIFFYWNS